MNKRINVTDLNGVWNFLPDKDDSGGEKGYMLASCDMSLWREAAIPCTFEGAAQEYADIAAPSGSADLQVV